ncbi:hypothetical protein CMI37_15315 [Candidatus Pacearchaeota archaeon]|jgi:hypothetical protein|nr:hypothetical protein [Candidatus Pacearchaeota archaeon]|tara:strand:+ start:3969 stop:4493 length:525 start_codon:yes stop_codon:yes gene_type:complete
MTIQDASNQLFTWFEENDNFEIGRDLKKILPIIDDEEATLTAFKIALEKLEEMQLVASKDYADKKYYILEKHMDAFQQNVELGPWTAKFVTQEINEFCEILQDNTDLCQASSIQEKDVRNLVHVIQWYKARILEKEQIISGTASLAALAGDALNGIDNKKDDDEGKNGNKKKKK